jgi:Glycoside Hydrolase Family 113
VRRRLVVAIAISLLAASCGGHPAPAPPAPARPELGIDVLWYLHPEDSAATIRAKSSRVVSYVAGLHANAISISFPFYMRGPLASAVRAGKSTPTPGDLAILVDEATAIGLSVNLRPLLNEGTLGVSRGAIFPGNPRGWFASYKKFLAPYLAMATAHRVTSFSVGAELSSLASDPDWIPLDAWMRTRFHGGLSFSNNWDAFAVGELGGGPVGEEGVDAYFPLRVADSASVGELVTGLERWLSRPRRIRLPDILVQEAGIAAQPGSYAHPQEWTGSRDWNFAVQAKWFRAMCAVVHQRHMVGIYFWDIDFNQNVRRPSPDSDPPLSFIGRQAAGAARNCFQYLAAHW